MFVDLGGTVVHISVADERFLRRNVFNCPTCGPDANMVVQWEEWYGPTCMCCRCGDRWSESPEPHDCRDPRPFKRDWKDERLAYHQGLWDKAVEGEPPTLADFRGDKADDGRDARGCPAGDGSCAHCGRVTDDQHKVRCRKAATGQETR